MGRNAQAAPPHSQLFHKSTIAKALVLYLWLCGPDATQIPIVVADTMHVSALPCRRQSADANVQNIDVFCSIRHSISGLVAEYIVAIDVTRVRFPADALIHSYAYGSNMTFAASQRHSLVMETSWRCLALQMATRRR